MTTYSLTINCTDADVERIDTNNERIIVVKQTKSDKPVIWQSFRAFPLNILEWEETYSIYASNTSMEVDHTLIQTSAKHNIQTDVLYLFKSNQFYASKGGKPGEYTCQNLDDMDLTFGLAQAASLNGSSTGGITPINGEIILNTQTVGFTPVEKINVYIGKYTDNGIVISEVASNALLVDLTGPDNAKQIIHFDGNQFVSGGLEL